MFRVQLLVQETKCRIESLIVDWRSILPRQVETESVSRQWYLLGATKESIYVPLVLNGIFGIPHGQS
jgi:hypothetical protein